MRNTKRPMHNLSILLCILLCAFYVTGCRIPSLETAECSAGRDVARQYYSLAIGGDLPNNPSGLERIKALRSPIYTAGRFIARTDRDWFNFSVIQPTSYRVGECFLLPDGRTQVEVTVIWRVDHENYQRRDNVTLGKNGDKWLIDHIDVGEQPGPNF